MLPIHAHAIKQEADLIERFVRSFRPRFAAAIETLNHRGAAVDPGPEVQCIRLCVETMDMILSNQDRMARALQQLARATPALKAA